MGLAHSSPAVMQNSCKVHFPKDMRPILMAVVDTEEEWSEPKLRTSTSITAMAHIHRLQELFEAYGVRPTYAVDYPVVSQAEGVSALRPIFDNKRAEIAAHLHPWVNPPFDEELSPRNSYAGNLPLELERQKLRVVTEAIGQAFGQRPTAYKAGRYGIGPNTAQILKSEGYSVDLSVSSRMDYRSDGGPDFSSTPCEPFWLGGDGRLLEIPVTAAFLGALRGAGPTLNRVARSRLGLRAHLPGLFARGLLLDRLRLSPEGFSHHDHVRLTRFLHKRGLRVFNFTFHSPSLVPGGTAHVSSARDVDRLLDRCRSYFDYFLGQLGGTSMTASEVLESVRAG